MSDETDRLNDMATMFEFDYDISAEEMRSRYEKAASARTGQVIICPTCGTSVRKRTYNKKFCSPGCKDRYWNTVDERRKERACLFNR